MPKRKIRRGDLVAVSWVDSTMRATTEQDNAEVAREHPVSAVSVGHVSALSKRGLTLSLTHFRYEDDDQRWRQTTCIPTCAIRRVEVLRRKTRKE